MPLKYALIENHLTETPNDYTAKVQDVRIRTMDYIIERIVSRGSTVTKADLLSAFEDYAAVVEECLVDGDGINNELHNIAPSIRGVFDGHDAPFDPDRHQVRFNLSPGVRLKKAQARVQLERVSPTLPRPEVTLFEDIASGTRNDTATPGGLARLTGMRLKFAEGFPDQGIFFIDSAGAETRVEMVSLNKPKSLHFQIPTTLATGAYTLEVRAVLNRGTNIRVGQLPHALQVS